MECEQNISIDIHNNILLIGKGGNKALLNRVVYYEEPREVLKTYGAGPLYEAFALCKAFDVKNVFVCNLHDLQSYVSLAKELKEQDFAYIVPLGLLLTDAYYDAALRKNIPYCRVLLESMQGGNRSVILCATKHAALYQDLDAFIAEAAADVRQFKQAVSGNARLRNLQVVANNLERFDFANVVLACMYCKTPVARYPALPRIGPAVFDLDAFDVEADFSYFKTLADGRTIVDNLLNLNRRAEPEKICTIDRILRFLQRSMDLTEFHGQAYSEYKKLLIRRKAEVLLRQLSPDVIEAYEIDLLTAKTERRHPGTVTVYLAVSVRPKNCLETVTFKVAVG